MKKIVITEDQFKRLIGEMTSQKKENSSKDSTNKPSAKKNLKITETADLKQLVEKLVKEELKKKY